MSLTQRKPRPLVRDAVSLRDDRLFIIACDDTYAPKQYFKFFRITRVQVHVIPTTDGTSAAQHVLERLLAIDHEADDELWMILDTDHFTEGTHLASFLNAINQARQRGVNVAVSRPCFEIWLLLHHEDESAVTSLLKAGDVETALRGKLGQYNKAKLRQEHYPLKSVSAACARAESLDKSVGGGEIPAGNTSRVYLIWKAIAAKALPSQLSSELKSLLPDVR
jgi:hypothetical protein